MSIREITPNFHIFARNISTAFQVFHCFCPKSQMLLSEFREKLWEIRAKPMENSGKSNGKIWAKATKKLGKRRHTFRAKIIDLPEFPLLLPEFPIAFFPEFPIAFARISGKSYGKFGQNQWKIWAKAMENSGKSNGKIWAKAMRKLGKWRHIFRAKIIAFARISIAFI